MKIILEAFGKLKSDVIDVPETCGFEFKMALYESAQVGDIMNGVPTLSPLITLATFQYTGRTSEVPIEIKNIKGDTIFKVFPKIYRLVDIIKR